MHVRSVGNGRSPSHAGFPACLDDIVFFSLSSLIAECVISDDSSQKRERAKVVDPTLSSAIAEPTVVTE
jgi:hypothetical protein